jgi:hypothetical protein
LVIEYLLHYFRKGSAPFQSLSTLPEAEAVRIMEALYVPGSILWRRFGNPVEYIRIRRPVERELYDTFKENGGRPRQDFPIYLVVGRPRWVVASVDPVTMQTTDEMRVPLTILEEDEVSFTYPDSMFCTFMRQKNLDPAIDPKYDGKVFNLKEIEKLIISDGLPAQGWNPDLPARLSYYIEAQVWNQKVLVEYVKKLGLSPMVNWPNENQSASGAWKT